MNRIGLVRCALFWLLSCAFSRIAFGQTDPDEDVFRSRVGVSIGMGVNYHNAQDVVNRVNGSGVVSRRVENFKSGVDFFGAVSIPLSTDWMAKLEYVYSFASYSLTSRAFSGFNEEFSYAFHMPTLIGQYVLYEGKTYNFRAGVGIGFHFGTYEEKLTTNINFDGTASGVGSLIELEGNTALGENLYAHLGVQARWEFVGDVKNQNGASPGGSYATSLHFFSVGARLGASYYF